MVGGGGGEGHYPLESSGAREGTSEALMALKGKNTPQEGEEETEGRDGGDRVPWCLHTGVIDTLTQLTP